MVSSKISSFRECRMITFVRKAKNLQLGCCTGSWGPLWALLRKERAPMPVPLWHPPALQLKDCPSPPSSCGNLQTFWAATWVVSGWCAGYNIAQLEWPAPNPQTPNPVSPSKPFLKCAFCRAQGFSGMSTVCVSRGTVSFQLLPLFPNEFNLVQIVESLAY